MRNNIIFSLLILFLSACQKDESAKSIYGIPADYYPLKIGSYHIYLVDSVYHNDITKKAENYQFQIKEVITDTFLDLSKDLNFRLEKYYRYKTDSTTFEATPWKFKCVWHVIKKSNSIERNEENIRTVNLTYPIKNGLTWNGNSYNTKGKWEFEYQKFKEAYLTYSNSVKVLQRDYENLIEKQYYEQYFSYGVGVTYFHYIDVQSQDLSKPNVPIMDRIEKGVQYTQKLVEYYVPK